MDRIQFARIKSLLSLTPSLFSNIRIHSNPYLIYFEMSNTFLDFECESSQLSKQLICPFQVIIETKKNKMPALREGDPQQYFQLSYSSVNKGTDKCGKMFFFYIFLFNLYPGQPC